VRRGTGLGSVRLLHRAACISSAAVAPGWTATRLLVPSRPFYRECTAGDKRVKTGHLCYVPHVSFDCCAFAPCGGSPRTNCRPCSCSVHKNLKCMKSMKQGRGGEGSPCALAPVSSMRSTLDAEARLQTTRIAHPSCRSYSSPPLPFTWALLFGAPTTPTCMPCSDALQCRWDSCSVLVGLPACFSSDLETPRPPAGEEVSRPHAMTKPQELPMTRRPAQRRLPSGWPW